MTVDPESRDRTHGVAGEALERDLPPEANRDLPEPPPLRKLVGPGVIAVGRERRSGAIVNVASISGKEGNPNQIPYSVSKAGTICLTKALAKEVIGDGIRVNAVAPALIGTPLLAQHTPEDIEYLRGRIPLGRLGRVEEVAAVVHFLASDDASFVTGQCYDVSGGRATY